MALATSPISASLGGTPQAVEFGAAMRDMRLAHNADLATVASNLRIRQVYLQAIEDGRFDDLPGPTYASGFVRAYGEYLGLDIAEVMRRYRDVTRGGVPQTPLVAPAPVSEGRMPTGFILLVAAVLAAAAYGSWYYLTLHDRDAGEVVASLPQRIAEIVGLGPSVEKETVPARPGAALSRLEVPAPAIPEPSAPVVREPAPPPEVREAPRAAPPAPVRPAPMQPTDPPTRASGAEEITVAPPAPQVAPAAEAPETASAQPEAVAPPVAEPAAPAPIAAETMPAAGREAAPEPVVPAEAPAPEPAPVTPDPEAAVASAPAAPEAAPPAAASDAERSRVVLRATAISWVELRDAEGKRVFSRLLKKGETYNVPPQSGITLATGNAGALDILVDGQAVAPIGPVGAVRRDVLLEPEALLRTGAPAR